MFLLVALAVIAYEASREKHRASTGYDVKR